MKHNHNDFCMHLSVSVCVYIKFKRNKMFVYVLPEYAAAQCI